MSNNNNINIGKPHIINLSLIKSAINIKNKQYYQSRFYIQFEKNNNKNIVIEDEEDIDMDEIECILSSLIFKKLIKGYIAHQNALVLSTKIAFPNIKDVNNWWKSDF